MKEEFDKNGYYVLRNVLTNSEVDRLARPIRAAFNSGNYDTFQEGSAYPLPGIHSMGPRILEEHPALAELSLAHPAIVAAVQELTAGGADFVFECIGLAPTIQQSVAMTGRGGTTVCVGVVGVTELVPLPVADLTLQEKKITGSYMGSNRFRFDMPKYVDFYLDGRLFLDEMISSRIPLEDLNTAFDKMRQGEVARQVIVFD